VLSKYVSQLITAGKSQKLDRTELLHIANEMYDVCSVHSARQFAGRHI